MNKQEAREHMTEQEKYTFDVLDRELMVFYKKKEDYINEVNIDFADYCGSLIHDKMKDQVVITARCSDHSTEVFIRETGKDKPFYGSRFNIYIKDEHIYTPEYKTSFQGIEISRSSGRVNSTDKDIETAAEWCLTYELFSNIDYVAGYFKTMYHNFKRLQDDINKAAKPVEELVSQVSKRVQQEKKDNVMKVLKDGAVFKYTEGSWNYHLVVVKMNKTTSHIKTYRRGYFSDEKLRMKTDELIEKILRKDFKVVDPQDIEAEKTVNA